MISPDGRWLAYSSNETGRQQVYVVSLPDGRSKYQVTTDGGYHPLWSRNGSELLYLTTENAVASVAVAGGTSLAFGAPQTLFPLPTLGAGVSAEDRLFDVTADGSRFVVMKPEGDGGASLTIVTDWLAELGAEGRKP
jgi:hypothetical protein